MLPWIPAALLHKKPGKTFLNLSKRKRFLRENRVAPTEDSQSVIQGDKDHIMHGGEDASIIVVAEACRAWENEVWGVEEFYRGTHL